MNIVKPKSKQPLPKEAKRVFKGIIFDVYQWHQKMFDGSYSTFEKLKRQDTVMVIPVTSDGKIILTKQEQPGKKFIGAVGGRVDDGENVLEAAKRELLEETGYKAEKYELFDAIQPISKIEWTVYTFIAKECKKVAEQSLDSGEKIELMYVSFGEFIDTVFNGEFQDSEIPSRLIRAGFAKIVLDKKKIGKLKKMFLD